MKRFTMVIVVMLACIMLLSACSGKGKLKDGTYSATAPAFADSGWKDTLEITVSGGKIASINWDATYKDDSITVTKKEYARSGEYGMLKADATAEWHDQAAALENFVIANGIDALKIKTDGKTDAVSGCTINVGGFDKLLREALAQASK